MIDVSDECFSAIIAECLVLLVTFLMGRGVTCSVGIRSKHVTCSLSCVTCGGYFEEGS